MKVLPLTLTLALLASCATAPADRASAEPQTLTASSESADRCGAEAGLDTFVALEEDGIRGGALSVQLPASVDQVFDALLDFERANGHRSWAESFELLETEADQFGPRRVARWNFRGKLGVKPVGDKGDLGVGL